MYIFLWLVRIKSILYIEEGTHCLYVSMRMHNEKKREYDEYRKNKKPRCR